MISLTFHELNPRKGTETSYRATKGDCWNNLSTNLIPARGLKLLSLLLLSPFSQLSAFHELNPRKGTETVHCRTSTTGEKAFHELNPRKGTETLNLTRENVERIILSTNLIPARGLKHSRTPCVNRSKYSFHELNPRKGTETFSRLFSLIK